MASWAAFVGLIGVLVLILLGLARLSTRVVTDGHAGRVPDGHVGSVPDGHTVRVTDDGRRTGTIGGHLGAPGGVDDRRLPRFESRRQYALRTAGARDAPGDLSTGALLLNVAFTQGLFGVAVLGGILYFEIPPSALGLGDGVTGLTAIGIGAGLGVVLWIATELVGRFADAAGVGYDEALRGTLAPDSPRGWVVLLGVILPVVAFVEELVFRGAAIGAVVAGFSTPAWAVALVSSLAFGAAHGAQGRVGMALATALGLALAVAFVATGSLVVVIVAHYLVNALEFVVHEGLDVDGLDGNGPDENEFDTNGHDVDRLA